MRTRTIYTARIRAGIRARSMGYPHKAIRQVSVFERELLRRMDERDEWKTMFPASTPIQVAIGLVTAHVERGGK